MTTKVCTKCGEEKLLSEFHNSKAKYHKDGHKTICKVCYNRYAVEWRRGNPQKVKDYNVMYRSDNIDTLREYSRQYYSEHKEKRKEYMDKWRPENKEWLREYEKLYREKCIEEDPEFYKKRSARRKEINPKWWIERYDKNRDKMIACAAKFRNNNRDKLRDRDRYSIEQLTDQYIIGRIYRVTGFPFSKIKQHPELIELKREQLLAHRLYKTIKQKCYGKPNAS